MVRHLLTDAAKNGAGNRYLVQHSAGSGKSNSIAWLAHQLIGLEHEGFVAFDSIVIVTDRRILDKQIRDRTCGSFYARTNIRTKPAIEIRETCIGRSAVLFQPHHPDLKLIRQRLVGVVANPDCGRRALATGDLQVPCRAVPDAGRDLLV